VYHCSLLLHFSCSLPHKCPGAELGCRGRNIACLYSFTSRLEWLKHTNLKLAEILLIRIKLTKQSMMKYGKRAVQRLKCVLQCCKVCLLEAMALNGCGTWSCCACVNNRKENAGVDNTTADTGYMHITGSVNRIVLLFLRNPMTTLKNFKHFAEC
jgi:hypothetical protein